MHPAGVPQLAQARVDQRIAGVSALPGLEILGRLLPGKPSIVLAQGLFRRVRKMEQQVMGELAPADLVEKLAVAPGAVLAARQRKMTDPVPPLARPDLAKMQVRRQP